MSVACETRKVEYILKWLEYITKDQIAMHAILFITWNGFIL